MSNLRSDKLRDAGDLARELAKLKEHPAWTTLRLEFEERKEAHLAKQARDLMAGGPEIEPINQRKLDYQRGFLRGAAAVFTAPDNAVAELERLLANERKDADG
jgi:hypothetical protein